MWALVLGANGFIGRSLIKELAEAQVNLICLDINPISESLFNAITQKVELIEIIGDYFKVSSKLIRLVTEKKIDIKWIYQLAGISDAKECINHPKKAFKYNVRLTQDIIDLARKTSNGNILFPSTGLLYGDSSEKAHNENDKLFSNTIYTANKLCSEEILRSYSQEYNARAIILRLCNIYGKDSSEKTVVGKILKQIRNKENISVYNENPVRDFLHKNDLIKAIIELTIHNSIRRKLQIYNVSSNKGIRIGELMRIAAEKYGIGINRNEEKNAKNKNSILILSNQKIIKKTKWRPEIDIEKGLGLSI